jgi:hypothetical protein
MRTILSTTTANRIPVTTDLNVSPLMLMGKPVTNGNGKGLMNDQWIYVNDGRGNYSINVNRAKYCEKIYMSNVTIQESIGGKLMDKDLKKFVEQVSDKLVFQKYGKWYRVFLRKVTNKTFTIDKVVPYYCIYNPNGRLAGHYAHQICIDWRRTFYVATS